MTLTDNDTVTAIRVDDLLIDPETGEILSEVDPGLDGLALRLKDAGEQRKAWEQAEAMLKSAIGKKLDDANLKSAVTPSGIPTWRTQVRKSAHASRIPEIREQFGLDDSSVNALYSCARDLDPKALNDYKRGSIEPNFVDAIDALIEEKTISFVLLQPIRRSAPKLEEVQVPA